MMMINGIGAAGMMQQRMQTSAGITDDQSTKLNDLLSQYDAEGLSSEDAEQVVKEIKELGITPGSELANALAENGFDAQELADAAGIGGKGRDGPPPPPPGGGGGGGSGRGVDQVDSAAVSLIAEVLESYDASEDGDDLWSNLTAALEEAGYDTSQPVIDFYA